VRSGTRLRTAPLCGMGWGCGGGGVLSWHVQEWNVGCVGGLGMCARAGGLWRFRDAGGDGRGGGAGVGRGPGQFGSPGVVAECDHLRGEYPPTHPRRDPAGLPQRSAAAARAGG